jgi:choline kinase
MTEMFCVVFGKQEGNNFETFLLSKLRQIQQRLREDFFFLLSLHIFVPDILRMLVRRERGEENIYWDKDKIFSTAFLMLIYNRLVSLYS